MLLVIFSIFLGHKCIFYFAFLPIYRSLNALPYWLHFVVFALIYMNFSLVTDFATMKIINFFIYSSNLHYDNETDSSLNKGGYETI